jgi:hypothetical protein
MNKFTEILVGLILVVVAIGEWVGNFTGFNFGPAATSFFKGGLVWMIILIGALFLVLGISDLKG